jgi:hypothetical protein
MATLNNNGSKSQRVKITLSLSQKTPYSSPTVSQTETQITRSSQTRYTIKIQRVAAGALRFAGKGPKIPHQPFHARTTEMIHTPSHDHTSYSKYGPIRASRNHPFEMQLLCRDLVTLSLSRPRSNRPRAILMHASLNALLHHYLTGQRPSLSPVTQCNGLSISQPRIRPKPSFFVLQM